MSVTNPYTSMDSFLMDLRSPEDPVRLRALQAACLMGPPAVEPLSRLAQDPDSETARAARRALWAVVRHVGGTVGRNQRTEVASLLVSALANGPIPLRRELLWMLSEIGDSRVVEPVARLLEEPELAEAARCCLQRIPGSQALRALKDAEKRLGEPIRSAARLALQQRGVKLGAPLSANKLPTKQTSLKAL